MKRILCQIIGSALCFIGVIGLLTPIPFGLIFLVAGLMFLIPTTPAVARGIKHLRRKSERFDNAMTSITRRLPTPYRRVLRETELSVLDF